MKNIVLIVLGALAVSGVSCGTINEGLASKLQNLAGHINAASHSKRDHSYDHSDPLFNPHSDGSSHFEIHGSSNHDLYGTRYDKHGNIKHEPYGTHYETHGHHEGHGADHVGHSDKKPHHYHSHHSGHYPSHYDGHHTSHYTDHHPSHYDGHHPSHYNGHNVGHNLGHHPNRKSNIYEVSKAIGQTARVALEGFKHGLNKPPQHHSHDPYLNVPYPSNIAFPFKPHKYRDVPVKSSH